MKKSVYINEILISNNRSKSIIDYSFPLFSSNINFIDKH